jgi:ribonuclease HII
MTTAKRKIARSRSQKERWRLEKLHAFEREAWNSGYPLVAGVDEVGRGPLAGPVVAACVVLGQPLRLRGLNDSKKVSPPERKRLAEEIKRACVCWTIGEASVAEIDTINIYQATLLAMQRAIEALPQQPDYMLVDALRLPFWTKPQQSLIKGDSRAASIAAASIIAKVYRDNLMQELHQLQPQYGFDSNKGYGSAAHLCALKEHGPSSEHRKTFGIVKTFFEPQQTLPGLK